MQNCLKAIAFGLTLFSLTYTSTAAAQEDYTVQSKHPSSRDAQAGNEQLINPGDVLEITVFRAPDLAQQVRVSSAGNATLALLGEVRLEGLTEAQAADSIAQQLQDHKFLSHPRVTVTIKESARGGVSVFGQVQHPGVYPAGGGRNLLDLLSLAGGVTNTAGANIVVKRRVGGEESVALDLKGGAAEGSAANDVLVYPGDSVIVPPAGIVYVLGAVARPGGFVMQDNGKITVLQALAQAGSPSGTAAANSTVLLRKAGNTYRVSKCHFSKMASGQEPDLELQANDILFVPNNRMKIMLRNTEAIIASVSTAAIYTAMH
jgi:polysaccharide export outer membrane protein